MKYSRLNFRFTVLLCLFVALFRFAAAEETEAPDPARALAREASACRRRAMDYRVLSLNALKNADAEREEAHKALVSAMTSGKSENIRKARDELNNAAEELEDVIGQVQKAVECSMKAEMSAKKAEEMCKAPRGDAGSGQKPDLDEIEDLLESSSKHLAKAEEISKKLRRDWLVPFFASTTTTSSTTSTTKALQPENAK